MIHFSETAISEILRLRTRRECPDAPLLRLKVQVGGCLDWFYIMEFDSTIRKDDWVYSYPPIQIAVDPQSMLYVSGLTIDYSEDLMGGGFRFQNPNVGKTCSCGNSFALTTEPASTQK